MELTLSHEIVYTTLPGEEEDACLVVVSLMNFPLDGDFFTTVLNNDKSPLILHAVEGGCLDINH